MRRAVGALFVGVGIGWYSLSRAAVRIYRQLKAHDTFSDGFEHKLTPKTEEEAERLLLRVGRALSGGELVNGKIKTSTYPESALSVDLLELIRYLNRREMGHLAYAERVLRGTLRNLLYALPGYGVRHIRNAPYLDSSEQHVSELSITEYGLRLKENASDLIRRPAAFGVKRHQKFSVSIQGLKWELEARVPIGLEDRMHRLVSQISDQVQPAAKIRSYIGYTIVATSLIAAALMSPWSKLGGQIPVSSRSGGSFVWTQLLFLICSASMCALIANLSTSWLNEETFANSKTLAKATTVVLALSTIVLGASLSSEGTNGGIFVNVALYVGILLSTLAADNLVSHTDARLKRLDVAAANGRVGRLVDAPGCRMR